MLAQLFWHSSKAGPERRGPDLPQPSDVIKNPSKTMATTRQRVADCPIICKMLIIKNFVFLTELNNYLRNEKRDVVHELTSFQVNSF